MPLMYDREKAQQDIAALQAQNSINQEEDKGILDTLWDNVTSGAELVADTAGDVLDAVRDYNAAAGGRGDLTLEQATDNLKMAPFNRIGNAFVNKYADKDTPLLSTFADSIQSSELAYTQIIPDEKKWEQARKIQQEIGIPAETVMYDQTAWKNANNLYDEYQKAKEFYGPDMSAEDMQQINPIIQKVSTADPAAGALIMADAYNTNKELSIIDTFNEYFEMGKMEMELNELGEKYREQKHSQEDLKRIKELQGQINDFYNKHNINFIDDPLASIAAGVGQSAPITMESMYSALEDQAAWSASLAWAGAGVGSVGGPAGSATGALIGGASGATIGFLKNLPKLTKTGLLLLKVNKGILAKNFVGEQLAKGAGKSLGSTIGATRGMLDSEIGGKYIEYRDMTDENGNPLMDHEEASTRAVITGSATSLLEVVPTVETLGRMTKGSKLYKQAVEEVFDAAGMKYTRKAIATDAAIDFTKNTFKGAFTESSEEMFQNITEDLMLNDIEATHNDKANGGVKPYTDIILDGMGAFVASYPTSLAFGVGGAAGSGIFSSSQYAVRKRNISRQEKMFGAELKNTAIGNALAADLQDAVHNSKLVQSAPDVQKQIIHEKAAGTGFENVYIDVEMALEKENGKEDLRAVAKAANISDEELDIAIEEKGTLSVPLECFAQSESSQELLESASYNAETKSIARMKKEAKSTMESIKKAYNENLAQQERIINTIITELFPAEENDKVSMARQDMAKSIIMTFSENPAMGWREMMKLVQDERMEIIGGALKYLEDTSGNGVSVIPTEDGKGFRASNNAQWYSDFFTEYGRKPTKAEKENIAEDMMRGKVSIGDYHNIPEEELQATNAALDEINGKIKALDEIKDKMLGLTGVEMKLTEGLSKEAYAGYRQIMDQLKHAPAKAVRAARMNAILLARHADLYAKIMQKKGNTDYTAKDYMDSVALRFGGQKLGGFSQLGAEVEKQKAAIRKKYEGTEQWMKAPNGKKTNLTEEQWLAVRTPAFKKWFGDWESDPETASKVIDENGEPLVVYHGTKRGMFADRFNTFEGNGKPIWHSSSEDYAKLYFSEKKWNERGDIYTDFLNIKNPVDVGNVEFGGTGSVKWLAEKLGVPFNEVAEIFGVKEKDEAKARLPYSYLYEAVNSPEFIKWAQNKGYDGIIEVESGNNTYGVFKPNQIKSAIANNGNYSADSDNIYYQAAAMRPENKKYILSNGSPDIAHIEKEMVAENGFVIKALPIRLQIGFQYGNKQGMGWTHLFTKHYDFLKAKGYTDESGSINPFDLLFDVLNNYQFITVSKVKEPASGQMVDRILFHKPAEGKHTGIAIVFEEMTDDLTHEHFYTPVSIMPQSARQEKNAKKEALSFPGERSPQDQQPAVGALYTSVGIKAGPKDDSFAREDSPSSFGITLSDIDYYVKKYTYGFDNNSPQINETLYQSAWHGSPYDFDEFDLGAIGNGQGGAVHGWGLYFANKKQVSEKYRKSVIAYKNKKTGEMLPTDITNAALEIEERYGHEKAIEVIQKGINNDPDATNISTKQQMLEFLANKDIYEKTKGRLYKVDIPNNKDLIQEENNYLNQPKAIQKKMAEAVNGLNDTQKASFVEKLQHYFMKDVEPSADAEAVISQAVALEKGLKAIQKYHSSKMQKVQERAMERGLISKSAIERVKKSPEEAAKVAKEYEAILKETQKLAEKAKKTEGVKKAKFKQTQQDKLESYKKEPSKLLEVENVISGKEFYKGITAAFGNDKQASLYLNEHGIKGITWNDEGGQFVIFDDKAISIIEKFNQGIKGSLTPMDNGQRIITLFESADESTFLHEMGHLFLLDLENLAKVDEQSAKELATVTEWAKFRKSDVKGYKGSPFEGEFLKLAADIEAAEKAGDLATADKLKRRWMHERFARGFEMYLEFGEAPSKGLRAVFRKFKQFLKILYFGFAGQGVRATPEVEKIMARMIASDTEIEAMALDSRYKDITKAGGEKLLEETEAQTMQRWHEEAKEEAKEKLMAIIMKDLSEEKKRERQAKIDKEREEVTTFMTSMPVYIAQKVIAETGSKDAVVEMGIYSSIEQLESDLEAVKDIPLDKAIEDHMADYEADLDKKQMDEEMTEEKLSKIMNQTYYHNKLLALETAALQERTRTMQRINSKAKNAIHEANVAIDGLDDDVEIKLDKNSPKVKAVLRALAKLRYADRWSTEDLQAIDKIINSSTKSEIAAALKEFETNSNQWKKNLKVLQEAFDGQHRIIENTAKADLDKKKLIDACSYRHYVSMEKNASNLMNMFIRQGKWEAALRQQQFRLQAAAMAKYAKKNQEKLKKLTDKVTKQLSARTVKVAKDERYWHRHLAYLLGLNKEAPVKPQELLSAAELFEGLNASLDIKDDEFKQQLYTIYEKISAQDFGGYMTLTMAELEDAVDMLTVLYTTGRDKFRMKSFDGKMLHEVVDEICWDPTGISVMTQNRYINPDTGGLGYNDILAKVPFIGENLSRVGQKYINAHIKPEELLKLIGDKAHKYIYGLYERAANDEGKMTAESVLKLKDILSVYSHAEKREWKKQKYTLETGAGTEKVSKENIICMALNRGNETNWHRLFRGLRVDPTELANFIDENMTEKDWDTVQALWDHIGSYWDQTVKVEEKLNGVTLKSVEPKEFIVRLPDGQQKTIRGGYYPIAYNPEKSLRAEEQSVDKAAQRTMKGAQVLGAGRGFTKGRSESLNIERPLRLSFDVIPNHLGDVIHNITYRIAARDVYRLVTSQKFEYLIRDTLGAEALRSITDWAVDCWKIMPNNTSQAEGAMNKLFGYFRRNATFNIMGYRMWPVIENSTNIFPMMDRLGVVNALSAIGDYYAHKKECDLMMLKSSFMTNRINSMDRDIKTMPGLFDEDMKGLGWMKQHAYSMMVYSDLMLSAPLWARAYKDSIAGHYVDVERENKEMVEALRAAQAKVDDLNAQMFDLKKEKQHILDQLHPGYEVEYSPQRMRAVGYLNSELARIKSQLEPMEKELWEAEKELDKLANVDLMLPDDILKEAEVRAVQTADGAVRNVFGSGHTKDLAPIQKGGEFAKMFTCFYSFFNTQANAILANYYKGKFAKEELTGLQNIAVWMPFAKSVLFRIFLTSALSTIMKMAFGLDGDDDKDKYRKVMNEDGTETKEEIPSLERFLTQYAKNTVSTASGTMVGVRDVASLVCTYLFDGYDMGGSKAGSVPTAFIDKAYSTFKLANKKEERDAKIAADEERRKARYEKMSPKQKKKFDEELQYRHPAKRITYADIAKSGVGTVTSVTAAQTGITDTMANTVMTTMQYMADGDGRYDPSLSNIMWSAFWNKKPVEREIPEKPEKPKKKNKKGA